MIRVAEERIADLFGLAEREARGGSLALADRYVSLARRIGMRYNVRVLPEYRELYCRGCSAFWVEGKTVRTRFRRGRRVRTCVACGRSRRVRLHPRAARGPEEEVPRTQVPRPAAALIGGAGEGTLEDGDDEEEEV